ncbi:hypothetical protein VIGAN_01472600 [Vigna angularis var. angularis]|uniref:Homeobox domain-containing protein n=1 Tax=Vigna angularis var. angularis TaxID=157739 RepID=A0A0S3R7Y6_PHAAN|nr:hypothetical protein VIGAN_01472600 [Vigna angularis var. angularis]
MNEMEMERYTSQRWRPTEDQVKMMTHIYNYGVTHPSRAQVVEIASRLRVFADATEYNVHCWFNNHGNRVRRWQAEIDPTGTQFSQLPLYMYGKYPDHLHPFFFENFLLLLLLTIFFVFFFLERKRLGDHEGAEAAELVPGSDHH